MRFLLILFVALVITVLAAPFTGDFSLLVEAALWIYSLTIAFLIDKAVARRGKLRTNVNVELARLRHIHHVCEQLPEPFLKKIDGLLREYEQMIEDEFLSHHTSTDAFRKLSHAIYAFNPKTEKEGILYADLLQTLQDLTLGRQLIQFELTCGLAPYDWFLLLVVLSCLMGLLLVPAEHLGSSGRTFLTFMAILVSLIPMEMLWKDDRYGSKAIKKFQSAYGKNIPEER